MRLRIVFPALLMLAACQQGGDDNFAIDESNSDNAIFETLPPDEIPVNDADVSGNSNTTASGLAIPAAFRGRWGMVPKDCTSTRGDAKGLVEIDASTMKFFESRGTLTRVTLNEPGNFTGTFAFTGEGQNWTNAQNLQLAGSGDRLVRSEADVSQSFTYQRCS